MGVGKVLQLAGALLASVITTWVVPADALADSLWLGNDGANRPVFNVTKSGSFIRQTVAMGNTGIAIDLASNDIYFSSLNNLPITRHDLTTLTFEASVTQSPGTTFGEDLAFDGTSLYRADYSGNRLFRVNPTTGAATVVMGGLNGPVGVAWDGSGLWVSEFNLGVVRRFDAAGNATGQAFATIGRSGGLAWDTSNGTLWVGSDSIVRNYTTTGLLISSFATSDSRFVDGLEYQGDPAAAVPLPATSLAVLLLMGIIGTTRVRGRRCRPSPDPA